ncbi:MAG: phosphotransferase, partial [bacterium]|nr:phosphotransferase [bacterium]
MQQWIDALKAPLATAFPNAGTVDEITRLCPAKDIADDTLKLLVRDSSGRSLAVVICSSSAVPGQVAKAMQRARDARSALGTELGRHVLEPLFEGEFQGLSYAVLPHCDALSNSRIGWHLQRRRLRPTLLGWLRATASETLAQPDETLVQRDFVEPLRRLGRLDGWPGALRETALNAAARAAEEHWSPRYVLIHNDFWRGNVLLDSTRSGPWPERFVVIDWGGSRVRGHAIFDLI